METRQQFITRSQVVCKMNEARNRCMRHLDLANAAISDQEFRNQLELSTRAANDAQVWQIVYNSLNN